MPRNVPNAHNSTTAIATTEIDDHIAIFDALDGAVDDLADTVLVFVELAVTFGFAHLLHDDLLGRLGGDAAEIHRRQRVGDEVTDLGVGIAVAGEQ